METRRRIPAIALALLVVPCVSAASTAAPETSPWHRPARTRDVDLTPPGEPGGRFVMEGRVLAAGDSAPLAGLMLYVYHADGKGWYALHQEDRYPRIAGVLRTDARGRYRVRTVLPGQYAGAPHIHFEAWGPSLPLHTWFVDLYRAPGQGPDSSWGRMGELRRPLNPKKPETFVTRDARGVFHARYDLRWDRGFVAPAPLDSTRRSR